MKVLDLFSGIGGFSLGLERAGMETVAFCEIDPFCQKILNKHWPDVPIFNDVRSLDYEGSIDLICGGYPCQPFSVAGNREGEADDRHLWPAMFSIIKKYRPNWVIGENVAGHVGMGLDAVLTQLESEGYSTRTFNIPACAVNAPHERQRIWIVAYSEGQQSSPPNNEQKQRKISKSKQGQFGRSCSGKDVSDSNSERRCGRNSRREDAKDVGKLSRSSRGNSGGVGFWDIEPSVGRVANGVPRRVDRLKSLGNSVVPEIPEIIGTAIIKIEQGLK